MVLAHRSDAYLWFLQYEVTKSTSTPDTPLDELQVHCMATSTAQVHNTLTSARAQTRPLDLELSTQTIRPDCFSPNSFTDPVIHSFLCAVFNPESSLGTKVQAITKFVESHAAQLSKVYTLKMFSYSILYESWRGFGFRRAYSTKWVLRIKKYMYHFKLSLFLNLLQCQTVRVVKHQEHAHLIGGCLQHNKQSLNTRS